MATVLVVDDKQNVRETIAAALTEFGYEGLDCAGAREALALVAQRAIDIIITDLKMPEMSGLELLKAVKEDYPRIGVIVLTAYGSIEEAVEAMRLGAIDFLTKPAEINELDVKIKRALEQQRISKKVEVYEDALKDFDYRLVGDSEPMRLINEQIQKIAPTNTTVMVRGESGTGKELVARTIHQMSPRANEAFVAVACAAIPATLLESELFGHEKGAFTNAMYQKPGKFELAHRGTIFLDEIGEIEPEIQSKLLRVLQEREFTRIGSNKIVKVDVRVIAATNRNLEEAMRQGAFREDLYYRLNVVPIFMPPLRDRKDDIPMLVEHLLAKHARKLNVPVRRFSDAAMAVLANHYWKGNVRELENVLERSLVMSSGAVIGVSDLPAELMQKPAQPQASPSTSSSALAPVETAAAMPADLTEAVGELEKNMNQKALAETRGNVSKAAELLRINRSTLQFKIKKYGMDSDES